MRLLCGDHVRQVDVSETREGVTVRVDGQPFVVEVTPAAPATFTLRGGTRVETFHCVRRGDEVHLFWRGTAYRLREETEGARAAHRSAGAGSLEAPMPGRVIAVKAVPGQAVTRGAELVVVESMKMENAIRAPRDGTVRAVTAKVGDMVGPGAVLVELE